MHSCTTIHLFFYKRTFTARTQNPGCGELLVLCSPPLRSQAPTSGLPLPAALPMFVHSPQTTAPQSLDGT